MRGKIYEQAIQQQKKKHINGFWKFKIISNSSLQKYNQEEEILFPTSETGKKKMSVGEAVLSGILIVAGGNANRSTPSGRHLTIPPKNWCFWTVVLEKTLASPLDCKDIQPVHPKGDQSWVFIGRTDAKAETPILWPPHGKSWFIGKDPDAGRDWGQEEKETTEDEMAGWHHWLDAHEFGWSLGVGDG